MSLKPSSQHVSEGNVIKDGDLVIAYESYDHMKSVRVASKDQLHNRFGVFKHKDWIGKQFGSKVYDTKGCNFMYLLAPTPELWTLVLAHRTQILYVADIALVVACLELRPGCCVLESGTGSGSLTTSLARAVAPTGRVHTFEFHEQRANAARQEFEENGLGGLVSVTLRDIQGEGFPAELAGQADAVFLDLPGPWMAVPSAARALRADAAFCSFSPCIEQVQKTCDALREHGFTDIRTCEILLRYYEVREEWVTSDFASPLPQQQHQHQQRQPHSGDDASVFSQTGPPAKRHCQDGQEEQEGGWRGRSGGRSRGRGRGRGRGGDWGGHADNGVGGGGGEELGDKGGALNGTSNDAHEHAVPGTAASAALAAAARTTSASAVNRSQSQSQSESITGAESRQEARESSGVGAAPGGNAGLEREREKHGDTAAGVALGSTTSQAGVAIAASSGRRNSSIVAKPVADTRGHTGYLTFARRCA